MDDEQIRLQFSTPGIESVDTAKRKLGELADQTHRLDTSMGSVAKGGGKDFGRAILEGSRALEDLQFGIMGVLNNIPSLTTALGGGAGLAGAISVVSVGAYQLYKHWDDFKEVLGLGSTKTEAERMEDLANKTHRTAEETKKLNEYKQQQAKIEQMLADRSKEAKKTEAAVQSVYAEAGPEKIAKGLAAMETSNPELLAKSDPEMADLLRRKQANEGALEGGGELGQLDDVTRRVVEANLRTIEGQIATKMRKAQEEAEAKGNKLMLDAKASPEKLADLMGKVKDRPDLFPKGFAAELQKASPEARRKREEMEIAGEEVPLQDLPKHEQDAERKKREAAFRRGDKQRGKAIGDLEEQIEKQIERDRDQLVEDLAKQQEKDFQADQKKAADATKTKGKAAGQDVSTLASQYGARLKDELVEAISRKMILGQSNEQITASLTDQLAARMMKGGASAEVAAGAADQVVKKAVGETQAGIAEQGGDRLAAASAIHRGLVGARIRAAGRQGGRGVDAAALVGEMAAGAMAPTPGKARSWHPKARAAAARAMRGAPKGAAKALPKMPAPKTAAMAKVDIADRIGKEVQQKNNDALGKLTETMEGLRGDIKKGVVPILP